MSVHLYAFVEYDLEFVWNLTIFICLFLFSETFHINPQLHLILSEMEEVVISLNQHSIMEPKVIGFTSYSLPKACMDSTGKEFFKKNKSLVNSQYTNSRQVWEYKNFNLSVGVYMILFIMFFPGKSQMLFGSGRILDNTHHI